MIRLVQEFGAHSGRQLTFTKDRIRLGRDPGSDVPFDPHADLDASTNHCEIVRESDGYYVANVGGRNGTFVNGQLVTRQRINSGDVIECGRGGPRLRVEISGITPTLATDAPAPLGPGAIASSPPAPALSSHAPAPGGPPFAPAVPPTPSGGPPPGFGAPTPFGSGFGGAPAVPPPAPNPFAPIASASSTPAQHSPAPAAPTPGGAVAANMQPGAKVGQRTVALMIDAALKQAKKSDGTGGLKRAVFVLAFVLVAGLGVGGYLLFRQREDTDRRLQEANGNAGERIAQENETSIYLLAAQRGPGRLRGFCTGFAVTSSLIATNAHCVELAQRVSGEGGTLVALRNFGRGAMIPITPVYRDARFRSPAHGTDGAGYDVGLMQAALPLPSTVTLASNDDLMGLRPGAQIFVYGFPGMTMNETSPVATITSGILNRSTDFFDRAADPPNAHKVQHSAQTTSGSSGSPIFLANGTVIAVNAGSLADEERQSIVDPTTGRRANVEVNRSSNFKYGMRADLIRQAVEAVGQRVQ